MPIDKYEKQRRLHKFLVSAFENRHRFTKEQLGDETQYPEVIKTYWSKQVRPLLENQGNGIYVVGEVFRRFLIWNEFQKHVVSQKRRLAADYNTLTYANVLIFEFFMPLANESHLRSSLDALFYRDTIIDRLKRVSPNRLHKYFPRANEVSDDEYTGGVCDWVQKKFGGYSISHVNGRFRADELMSRTEAASHSRYLVDETTAIVRFIFPCGIDRATPLHEGYFEELFDDISNDSDAQQEAMKIRWLFGALFVRSVVQIVSGEDEIWMLESGMQNRLHIWRVNE
jgi:hypothetical protein